MNDLDLILQAAKEAGELALSARAGGLKIWSKEGGSPVTDADLAVDTLLKTELAPRVPTMAGCRRRRPTIRPA
jgi:myo-inositol-1(or 4)-monophosphatase